MGLLALGVGAGACSPDESKPPAPVVVTHELTTDWEIYPHRISQLELTFEADGARRGELVAQAAGGPFGALDTPSAFYGLEYWSSSALVAVHGSRTVEIPPDSTDGGEAFAASVSEERVIPELADTDDQVALIRGFRIDTDRYDQNPSWVTDIPYDPGNGYTTQGLGISLGDPQVDADGRLAFDIRVRNSLGTADRADMNEAIPQATTWIRVDYIVIGCRGTCEVAGNGVSYTLSTAEYGEDTVHPHGSDAEQTFYTDAAPGSSSTHALFGVTGFDVWVNQDAYKDPACEVVQDDVNFEGDPVSGPGRYMTTFSVRLRDLAHDAGSGEGTGKLDLFFSNSSSFREIGNLCLGVAGTVGMLQFDDAQAEQVTFDTFGLSFTADERFTSEVSW